MKNSILSVGTLAMMLALPVTAKAQGVPGDRPSGYTGCVAALAPQLCSAGRVPVCMGRL